MSAPELTAAARDVLAERERQITAEGWTPDHDDGHADGSIAMAAATYAACASEQAAGWDGPFAAPPSLWPWAQGWFKPCDARRNLVKAGALILAEIERIDRAKALEVKP